MRGITVSEIWSEKRNFDERELIWEGLLHLKSGLKRGPLVRGDLYERDYCIWNLVWKEDLRWYSNPSHISPISPKVLFSDQISDAVIPLI
jgi:hypothetical protein